ncbi:hypothetical protein Droror1_Dr00010265 [Drosera rotundifolia]
MLEKILETVPSDRPTVVHQQDGNRSTWKPNHKNQAIPKFTKIPAISTKPQNSKIEQYSTKIPNHKVPAISRTLNRTIHQNSSTKPKLNRNPVPNSTKPQNPRWGFRRAGIFFVGEDGEEEEIGESEMERSMGEDGEVDGGRWRDGGARH